MVVRATGDGAGVGGPGRAGARRAGPGEERQAERRRAAFRNFMLRHGLTPAEWARLAGLANGNALYNFLAGRSATLSQPTLQRLADALPGVLVSDIFGETEAKRRDLSAFAAPEPLPASERVGRTAVRSAARAGFWRRAYELPGADQAEVAFAPPPEGRVDEAVRIDDDHCDQLFPPGACALVQRLGEGEAAVLREGDAVVVVRSRRRPPPARARARGVTAASVVEHEVTVRQVSRAEAPEGGGEGMCLVWRSRCPDYRDVVPLPSPYGGGEFACTLEPDDAGRRTRYEVVGVVLYALVPARALPD